MCQIEKFLYKCSLVYFYESASYLQHKSTNFSFLLRHLNNFSLCSRIWKIFSGNQLWPIRKQEASRWSRTFLTYSERLKLPQNLWMTRHWALRCLLCIKQKISYSSVLLDIYAQTCEHLTSHWFIVLFKFISRANVSNN